MKDIPIAQSMMNHKGVLHQEAISIDPTDSLTDELHKESQVISKIK